MADRDTSDNDPKKMDKTRGVPGAHGDENDFDHGATGVTEHRKSADEIAPTEGRKND